MCWKYHRNFPMNFIIFKVNTNQEMQNQTFDLFSGFPFPQMVPQMPQTLFPSYYDHLQNYQAVPSMPIHLTLPMQRPQQQISDLDLCRWYHYFASQSSSQTSIRSTLQTEYEKVLEQHALLIQPSKPKQKVPEAKLDVPVAQPVSQEQDHEPSNTERNEHSISSSDQFEIDAKRVYRRMCIQRYKNKTRQWKKKVHYDQRKEVADHRLRIQGRFISRREQQSLNLLLGADGIQVVFDTNRNLDVKKLQEKTQLFRRLRKSITKQEIVEKVHLRASPEFINGLLQKRILTQQPVFEVLSFAPKKSQRNRNL